MYESKLKLTGNVVISINGKVKKEIKNTVVTVGKEWVASRMAGDLSATMTHMALGTSSTPVPDPPDDTLLGSEIALSGDVRQTATATPNGNTIQYVTTWPAGVASEEIFEAGIFNAETTNTGIMLARTTFGGITKAPDDIMTITWTITIN